MFVLIKAAVLVSIVVRIPTVTQETRVQFPDGEATHPLASLVAVGKESACNAGDLGSIPGLGRSPGEGNGNPLQYSCLENPMDREAWKANSPWGRKSRTQLSD